MQGGPPVLESDQMSLSAVHDPEQAGRAASLVAVPTGRYMEAPCCKKVNALAASNASCSSRVNIRGRSKLFEFSLHDVQ
eukprot:751623-Pyramimonas_sp.AAC.1